MTERIHEIRNQTRDAHHGLAKNTYQRTPKDDSHEKQSPDESSASLEWLCQVVISSLKELSANKTSITETSLRGILSSNNEFLHWLSQREMNVRGHDDEGVNTRARTRLPQTVPDGPRPHETDAVHLMGGSAGLPAFAKDFYKRSLLTLILLADTHHDKNLSQCIEIFRSSILDDSPLEDQDRYLSDIKKIIYSENFNAATNINHIQPRAMVNDNSDNQVNDSDIVGIFSRIEKTVSDICQIYRSILSYLENHIGNHYPEESREFQIQVAHCGTFEDMVHITQQFRGMVTRHIDHVVIDRNQVLDFVSELGKNLMQVERQLIFSLSQARENHQANEGFHVKLQTQMEDIEDAFHPGRTLEELRRLVFSKLKAIKSALECKQDEDERRIQETHQKMGELQSTLHSMKKEIHVVLERARTLEKEASRDALTGIHNRRAYETRIQEELQRFHRYNQGFSLVLFDVDHFKRVNDQYGHRAGDKCLKEIVNRIKPHLRKSDFMARYGGEEFMIILPGTSKEDAYRTAEKIRLLIERTRYVYQERDIPVTISLGVTSTCPTDRGVEGLFARVDGALYQAKNSGRNRTCVG